MKAAEARESDLPDTWTSAFVDLVTTRFGQSVPARRLDTFRRALVEAYMVSGEASLEDFRKRLASEPLESASVAEFVSRITVKESYFFRDDLTMSSLRGIVLPKLINRRAAVKRLTIWSAGCSNGEETYTLAILVDQILGGSPDWRIQIVGTDIDEAALRFARAGEYGEWSTRTMTPEIRGRYFDARGSRFAIRDRFRRWVRFEAHNLAEADALIPQPGEFDLVLCRNVGIYLSDAAINTLYLQLTRSLAPDGLVVTAASDPRPVVPNLLRPVLIRGESHVTLAYATDGSQWDANGTRVPPEETQDSLRPTIPAPPRMPTSLPPDPPAPKPVPPSEDTPADEASLDATAFFERALIELDRGDHGAAEGLLRKALYLAPGFSEAHYRLGLLCARRGDLASARRLFFNALRTSRAGEHEPLARSIGVQLAMLEVRR